MKLEIVNTFKKDKLNFKRRTDYERLFLPVYKSLATLGRDEVLQIKVYSSYAVKKLRDAIQAEFKVTKYRVLGRKNGSGYDVFIFQQDDK